MEKGKTKKTTNKNKKNLKTSTNKKTKELVNENYAQNIEKIKVHKNDFLKKEQIIKDNNSKKIMDNDTDFAKYIKIILIITAVLLFIYFITYFIVNKDGKTKEQESTTNNATIQYEEILASKMFNQNNNEYYVFIYDKDDNYLNTFNTYLSLYNYKEGSKKVYKINLGSDFNKIIKGEKNIHLVSNVKDFRTTNTTLIKIKNKRVVESYQGNQDIITHLKKITD